MNSQDLRSTRAPTAPRVTMGMPVYNGEQFLEEALRSLLGQTFEDFELVISDNASTDRTSSLCLDYAARDPRIRYSRNDVNVGLGRNQNSVITRAVGEFFLLTHHDDIRMPDYLARTVEVLDADRSLVLCYSKTRDIDEHGRELAREDPPLRLDSKDLRVRFRDIIRMDHLNVAIFGLTRMDVLRKTKLHGSYADSDRVLMAELLLHGPIHQVPAYLFFRRSHEQQSTAIAPSRQARTVWFDPAHRNKLIFPHFRELKEYLGAIGRAPIGWKDRAWCTAEMLRWMNTNRARLIDDLDTAGRDFLRPFYHAIRRKTV